MGAAHGGIYILKKAIANAYNKGDGPECLYPHPLILSPNCLLPRSLSTMRHQAPGADSVALSNSTAFAICDGLLRMSHCFIIELPEPELREIRRILDSLLMTADLALDLMETDISLNFDGLSIRPGESLFLYYTDLPGLTISSTPLSFSGRGIRRGHGLNHCHNRFKSIPLHSYNATPRHHQLSLCPYRGLIPTSGSNSCSYPCSGTRANPDFAQYPRPPSPYPFLSRKCRVP